MDITYSKGKKMREQLQFNKQEKEKRCFNVV